MKIPGKESHSIVLHTRFVPSLVFFLVLFCSFLTACVPIPMKVVTRVRPVSGEELRAEPDTSVIKVGVTTRSEILQSFAAFDTGWKGERLFLGRWLRSAFSANVADENQRVWGGRNLLVEFNEKGTVLRYQVLNDQKFLDELPRVLSTDERIPELKYSASGAEIAIDNTTGKQFLDLPCGSIYSPGNCDVAPEQVERLSAVTGFTASHFILVILMSEKIPVNISQDDTGTPSPRKSAQYVKSIRVNADLPTVVLLVHFLHLPSARH
jgi:hypothetical protein